MHSSFPQLGLPAWFGYFIGVCEVLGCIALLLRPLRALAFILLILSAYISWTARADLLKFRPSPSGTTA